MLYDSDRIGFHYQIRVIASVLFIDRWDNSDIISITVEPNILLTLQKGGSSGSSSTNVGNLCTNGSNGRDDFFVKGDTNNKDHTALAFSVKVSAPNKSQSSWMLVDLIL